MNRPTPSSTALPRTFRAGATYVRGPGLFVVLCLIAVALLADKRLLAPMATFGAIGIASLGLFVSAVTLQITMDADGLTQRWVWGRRHIGWHQVASIERTRRGRFLLDEKGREIFAVSALPLAAQEVITEAAIKNARLRRDKQKPKPPITERWVRK